MRKLSLTLLVSSAVFALGGCDSENVENTAVDDIDEIVDEDEPYPVGGELSEEQQANFEAMDRQAVSDEYDANRNAMEVQGQSAGGSSEQQINERDRPGREEIESEEAGGSASSSMAQASPTAADTDTSARSFPRRAEMSFEYLDRNDDGQLSVAEYAIWALPTNPVPPEPSDALGPHLTTDEINQAGQTFFYFDDDGNTYLSPAEFQEARNSTRK